MVEYKRGRENKAADALSRVPFSELDEEDGNITIENNAGTQNVVGAEGEDATITTEADTESAERQEAVQKNQSNMQKSQVQAISTIKADWLEELKKAYLEDPLL